MTLCKHSMVALPYSMRHGTESLRHSLIAAAFVLASASAGFAGSNDAAPDWPWAQYGLPPTENPCAIPTPWPEGDWRWSAHEGVKATSFPRDINVVFLGDSITHGWNFMPDYPNGAAVLKEYSEKFPAIRARSLGVSSDQPQNTLWLLTEGALLDPFPDPKAIVLMIGINSLNKKFTPEQVTGGIQTIIRHLQSIRPNTKLLILGVLPCWGPTAPVRKEISRTNEILRTFADGKDVFFLDFGEKLLDANGNILADRSYDEIHLTDKGYAAWAESMFPLLDSIVQTGSAPPSEN